MSLHRSLVVGSRARRHRNVLSREEQIVKLEEEGRWDEAKSVFGLPKVRSIKPAAGGRKAKKKEAAAEAPGEAAPGEAAPAP